MFPEPNEANVSIQFDPHQVAEEQALLAQFEQQENEDPNEGSAVLNESNAQMASPSPEKQVSRLGRTRRSRYNVNERRQAKVWGHAPGGQENQADHDESQYNLE